MKETYKILIVDDEPSILDMLKLQLESEGYVVYTAINAKEALDKLSNCPDIIYITKPFSMSELLARLSAHLRRENRSHKKTKNKFSEELIIDYSDRSLYIKNNRIELSNKEFEIIQLLSANAGQVFDREKIYEIIWGFNSNGDSAVIKEHIRKIRSKFSEYTEKAYISTVWGVGYKWIK